ncbi:MAG: TraR/DksA C4-type zinc finger protein [Sphingorhabdus sp.]
MAQGLSDRQLAAMHDRLLTLQAKLKAQDKDSAGWREPVELDQQSVGRLSRMDALQQQAMSEAEARRRQGDLTRIDAALARIESQEYGWCAVCGEGVAIKRLEIDPMATHCVGCAK